MARDKEKGDAERPGKRASGVDLADIKAAAQTNSPSVAESEIAKLIAAEKADRFGRIAREVVPETATEFLKRQLDGIDPLGTAVKRAGLFRGGVAERAVREALGGDLASTAAAAQRAIGIVDRTALDAARGFAADQTSREIVEAQRKMSDLVLGRTAADEGIASAVRAAQASVGQLDWGSHHATGRAALAALEDTYSVLGIGKDRERLLGTVAGVGSFARIAAGLADGADGMRLRTGDMLLEAQRRIEAEAATGTIGYALRAGYGDLFPEMRSPRASEIEAVIEASRTIDALKPYPDWASDARSRFEALTTPWVRADLPDASIAAMSRLTMLDRTVDFLPPWEAEVVEALRDRLGDYREAPEPDPETVADPIARTGYQLGLGFDPVLSVLPTAVVAAIFAPFAATDPHVPVNADHLENAVRMMMKRLERALRRFIAEKLRSHYGEAWFDHMPSEIRRAWSAGRQKDVDEGRAPDELIAYADIDHYRRIIEHPDRWGALFEPVFKDQAAIRETLRRIAVVRNPGAHFRAVTLEDLIILRAEGAHLAKWLGIRLGD